MNHRDERRLTDILDAITTIESHLGRGDLSDGSISRRPDSATRIGEAVTAIPTVTSDLPELRDAVTRLMDPPDEE